MTNALLDSLPDEPVLQSNTLATVTPSFVVIHTIKGGRQNMVSLALVKEARRATTTYPGLLVIAAALFLIAAAAYASKQGANAQLPAAILGLIFSTLYFSSRRAALVLILPDEVLETDSGAISEADALVKAIQKARAALAIHE